MVLKIKSLNSNSDKKGNIGGYVTAFGVACIIGGSIYYASTNSEGGSVQPQDLTGEMDNPDLYISTLTADNSTRYSVTSTGTGSDRSYTIEVDKDDLPSNSLENFTIGYTQDIKQAYDSNFKFPQTLYVPKFDNQEDLVFQDSSGDEIIFFDGSASTIGGSEDYLKVDFSGSTEISKTLALKTNPHSSTLSDATALDDVGEDEEISLDFGQVNDITLRVKN